MFNCSHDFYVCIIVEHSESQPPLDWPKRKRIALGSARGLAYLHDHCDPKIIHRDVKAANIFWMSNSKQLLETLGWLN